jgi:hypothetical protein
MSQENQVSVLCVDHSIKFTSPAKFPDPKAPLWPRDREETNAQSDIEKLRPIQYEIIEELCKAFHNLKSPVGFLAALGSYGDTMPESEILAMLKDMNSQYATSTSIASTQV